MAHSGGEGGGHSHGMFEYRSADQRRLALSLSITAVVMVVEIVGGILAGSIALISDAGHMFTHCFAIGIGLGAIIIARRPPCHHHTYGLYRAEVLAAFTNGLFLLVVVTFIIIESVKRILQPGEVFGLEMLMVALIGLVTNLASILILSGARKGDLNIRGVMYHLGADAASSVGIVAAAVVIMFTGWHILDPIVSLGISALIVAWSVSILREASKILLQVAPRDLDADMVAVDLKRRFPGITDIYHVHLWTITSDMLVFSAHVRLKDGGGAEKLILRMNRYLAKKYHIIESTIQVDSEESPTTCTLAEMCDAADTTCTHGSGGRRGRRKRGGS